MCFIDINSEMQGNNEVGSVRGEFGHSSSVSHTGCGVWLLLCHFWEQLLVDWACVIFILVMLGKKENLGSVNPGEVLIGNSYFETFSSLMYFTLGTYYCGKILSHLCKGFLPESTGIF